MADTNQVNSGVLIAVISLISFAGFSCTVWIVRKYIIDLGREAEARYLSWKKTLEGISRDVVAIRIGMERKLDRTEHETHCRQETDEMWKRINKHSHKFDREHNLVGKVVIEE